MSAMDASRLPSGWLDLVSRATRLPLDYVGDAVDGVMMRCDVNGLGPVVSYLFIVDGREFKAHTLDGLVMLDGTMFTLPPARERLVEAMGRSVMWRAAGGMGPGDRAVIEAIVWNGTGVGLGSAEIMLFVDDPRTAACVSSSWFGLS